MEFPTAIIFSHEEVVESRCYCPECRKSYWGWYSEKPKCRYVAALGLYLRDYLKSENFADATDMNGDTLLSIFQKGRARAIRAEQKEGQEPYVELIPRLTKKNDKLSVSFKVGTGKLFVVKKLNEFCMQVKEGAVVQYGSSTQISHRMQDFTEKSKKWISYIDQIVREENRFVGKIMESGIYLPKKFDVGGSLDLFGWRLDRFYEADKSISIRCSDSAWEPFNIRKE